jgi:mono/diheme cytochrome c family protein
VQRRPRKHADGGLLLIACLLLALGTPALADDGLVERGRYLVVIAGCNDCHTPRYAENGGEVPEAQWLTGDAVGWRGAWGTTYPPNLRLYMQSVDEDEWVKRAKTLVARPPMPWFSVRRMSEQDLRAIHRYVRQLGPAGGPAPDYVPPDRTPVTPYVQFPEPPR